MNQLNINRLSDSAAVGSSRESICRLGAAAAIAAIMLVLLDMAISMGGGDVNPDTLTALDWFTMFQDNKLVGLRMLGIIYVISLTVSIPLYFALYTVHRQVCREYAFLAMILFLVGAAVYISNNAAVPMLVLSSKYSAAADSQRMLLAAAGEAIAARGADFTPGSFIGFFFTELAGLSFSIIMLHSRLFGRAAACFGILGYLMLTVFTIWLTFIPVFFDAAMAIAAIGGLSCMAWNILVARGLIRLGSDINSKKERRLS